MSIYEASIYEATLNGETVRFEASEYETAIPSLVARHPGRGVQS